MRQLVTRSGIINLYEDDLGKPSLKIGNYYIPLVPIGHLKASNIRIRQGYALAFEARFNFKQALVKPYLQDGAVVFPKFNGEIMFRLEVAHG